MPNSMSEIRASRGTGPEKQIREEQSISRKMGRIRKKFSSM